jgi:hypothetical protein
MPLIVLRILSNHVDRRIVLYQACSRQINWLDVCTGRTARARVVMCGASSLNWCLNGLKYILKGIVLKLVEDFKWNSVIF